jgi:protein-S-isoprenylcysteine O-methyltransferase Ste14
MTVQDKLVRLRPPRIAMVLAGAAAVAHLAIPFATLPSWRFAAVPTGMAGLATMLRAWWLFRQVGTPICPTENATMLITDDVFATTRNPMYLGMVMMMLAIALFVGTAPFYVAALLNFLILHFVFCPYEERRLQRTFSEYDAYAARVPRWI